MPKLILINLQYSTMCQISGKNRKYLCIKKSLKTSLKTGFAQISLAAQKIRVAQNFLWGGAAAPLAPPARTPMYKSVEIEV